MEKKERTLSTKLLEIVANSTARNKSFLFIRFFYLLALLFHFIVFHFFSFLPMLTSETIHESFINKSWTQGRALYVTCVLAKCRGSMALCFTAK